MLGEEEACCPPSSSTRIKSLATAIIDQQTYALKGTQSKDEDEALLALGKQEKQALGSQKYFRRNFFVNLDSCIIPYFEQH